MLYVQACPPHSKWTEGAIDAEPYYYPAEYNARIIEKRQAFPLPSRV
jgi:hypothetical protein